MVHFYVNLDVSGAGFGANPFKGGLSEHIMSGADYYY